VKQMSVQSIGQKLFDEMSKVFSDAGYEGTFSKDAADSSVWTWQARNRKAVLEIDEKKSEFAITIINPADGDNTMRKRILNGNKVSFELDPRASLTTPNEKVFLKELQQQLSLHVYHFVLYPNGNTSQFSFVKLVPLNQSNEQIVAGLQEDLARSLCKLASAYYYEGDEKVVIFESKRKQ
jgi:hypothetical protein